MATNTIGARLESYKWWLLFGLIAGIALSIRFLIVWGAPLVGDEAYYWMWSRRLDWAYFDHPAGVALLIRMSTALGLPDKVGVRWLNAILGFVLYPLIYFIGAHLFSKRAGLYAACILALGAPYLLISGIVYTDTLLLFFLLLNLWCFCMLTEISTPIKLNKSRHSFVLFLLWGLTLACLFNTKYSAYLYASGLGLFIILKKRWLFHHWNFYLALLIASAGLVPVLIWNASHGWVSFQWQLTHLVSASPGGDFAGLLLIPFHNVWHAMGYMTWPVVMAVIPAFAVRFRPISSQQLLLGTLASFLLIPVIFSPANSPRNFIAGLTLLLLMAGENLQLPNNRINTMITGLLALLSLIYGIGTAYGLLKKPTVFSSTVVPELRYETAGMHELIQLLDNYPDPVFALDYQLAGYLTFTTGQQAYSGWGQYLIWGIPEVKNYTVVSLGYLSDTCVTDELEQLFQVVNEPQRFDISDGEFAKEINIWQVSGPESSSLSWARKLDFLNLWELCQ